MVLGVREKLESARRLSGRRESVRRLRRNLSPLGVKEKLESVRRLRRNSSPLGVKEKLESARR